MEWWVVLLLPLVLLIVHWFDYSRSIQEYTFAQPAGDLGSVMTEKTPVVMEVGALPWRPEIAEVSGWTVETSDGRSVSIKLWNPSQDGIENNDDLAEQMELAKGLGEIADARPMWWLPELQGVSVDILRDRDVVELSWVTAERQWVGCSAGGPLLMWLVHSRYRRYLPATVQDPWALTVETAPYIGRVQYIEVRIQPGWAIGLPAHWGYSIRAEGGAWTWAAEQHSVLSLGVTKSPLVMDRVIETVRETVEQMTPEDSDAKLP